MQAKFSKDSFYIRAFVFIALVLGLVLPAQTVQADFATYDNPDYYYANITSAPINVYYRQAAFSPDGTKILAQKSWNDGTARTEVVVMNADGSGEAVISAGDSGVGDIYGYMNPFWSDDGTAIGFAEVHNANPNKIIVYNLSTATSSYIYEPVAPQDVNNADFLGDSKTNIIFWAYGPVGGADLFTWDGTTLTNVTNTADYKEYEPVSNADGTLIVYWSGETTTEPTNTTHTLTYSAGTWTKDVGFTPITDSYWSTWTTSDATHIALTVMSSKDVHIYDNTGTFVADLSGPGYSGGAGQWNFFGTLAEGPNGEYAITSNAGRTDAGRDIVIATARTDLYVDDDGSDANPGTEAAPFATIQKAIDESVVGSTVHVAAGTYNVASTILVNESVTITGPAGGGAIVQGTGTDMFKVFVIATSNVTIQNLVITLATTPAYPLLVSDELNSSLISIPSGSAMTGIAITDNEIYVPAQTPPMSNWTARAITVGSNTVSGLSITGNTIYNTRNGVVIHYNNTVTISDNTIYNTKGGIMNYTGSQADADNRTMSNNSWSTVHNEWDIVWNSGGGPYDQDYHKDVLLLSGANNDAYVLSLMTATQTPTTITGNRSHVWVNSATGTTTLKGSNGNMNLPYATLQLGVDAVVDGGTVYVAAGTYDNTLDIVNREGITILGENAATTIVRPSTTLGWNVASYGTARKTVLRVVNSNGISIQNLTFDLDLVKANNVYAALFWDSQADLSGNTFKNNQVPDASGGYYEFGIAVRAPSFTDAARAQVTLDGNIFMDLGRVAILIHDFVNATITGNTIYKTVDDFGYGIELGSTSAGLITDNTFYGFDTPAASDGSSSAAIYVENAFTSAVVTQVVKNVTISDNEIYGNQYAMTIGNQFNNYAGNVDINLTVTGNNIHDNVEGGMIVTDEDKANGSSVNATFSGNTVNNNGAVGYFLYTVGDGDLTVLIDGDIISNHDDVGVYLEDYATGASTSSYNITVHNSQITGNTNYGVQNDYDAVTLDAENNWWGSSTGPGVVGPGAGDKVSTFVDYSPWCADAACTSFAPVVLISPDGIQSPWTNTFSWTGLSNATWYKLEVSRTDGTVVYSKWYTIAESCVGIACQVSPADTLNLPAGDYRWRILDYGAYGYGPWTGYMTFSLSAPTVVVLNSPSGSQSPWTNIFNWSGLSASTWYKLEVSKTDGTVVFTKWYTIAQACIGTACQISPDATRSLPAGDYRWRILDYGAYGYGPWTGYMTFSVPAPTGVVLNSPNGSQSPWTNIFNWSGLSASTWYKLEVSRIDGTVVYSKWYTIAQACISTACQVSPAETLSLPVGSYRWRILDYGPYGYGLWTSHMFFSIP